MGKAFSGIQPHVSSATCASLEVWVPTLVQRGGCRERGSSQEKRNQAGLFSLPCWRHRLLILLGTLHVRGENSWYYRKRNSALNLGDFFFGHQQKATWEETFSKNGDQKNVTSFKDVFKLKARIMTWLPTCFGFFRINTVTLGLV